MTHAQRADMAPAVTSVLQELSIPEEEVTWLRSHQVGASCAIPGAIPVQDVVSPSE